MCLPKKDRISGRCTYGTFLSNDSAIAGARFVVKLESLEYVSLLNNAKYIVTSAGKAKSLTYTTLLSAIPVLYTLSSQYYGGQILTESIPHILF